MQAIFLAGDIECDGCAASIRKALGAVDGVETVAVDINHKRVTVDFDKNKTDDVTLAELLDEIGFPPNRM